jgi:hypothetical protein
VVVTALVEVAPMLVATVVVTGSVTVVVDPGVSAANSNAAAAPRIKAPAMPSSHRCFSGSAGRAIVADWSDVALVGKFPPWLTIGLNICAERDIPVVGL